MTTLPWSANWLRPNPKLFFIGFNKTGTTSFHKFFKANGYLSAHAGVVVLPRPRRRHVGLTIDQNIAAGRPPLRGLSHYRVFSGTSRARDGWIIEANAHFRALHTAHPDAYFILNTRPVENWIRSRSRHKNGALLAAHARIRGLEEAEVEQAWRAEHDAFFAEATAYFAANPRFLVFDIETDPIDSLAAFLAPDFHLDTEHWRHLNKT